MITKKDLIKNGYTVIEKGAWFRIDPGIIPSEWSEVCKDFDIDPDCSSAKLCVCGVIEEYDENF